MGWCCTYGADGGDVSTAGVTQDLRNREIVP